MRTIKLNEAQKAKVGRTDAGDVVMELGPGALRMTPTRARRLAKALKEAAGKPKRTPHQRNKGARGEREACAAVRQHLGIEISRTAQHSGKEAADLRSRDIPHAHWEIKRHAAIGAWGFLEQADRDRAAEQFPLVVMRPDHDVDWAILLRLHDTPEFVRHLYPYLERRR